MKKLYHKGTVHPSPPLISDQLSFLPATILTLTAALSPDDREVLAYLLSCSSAPTSNFTGNPRRSAAKGTVETDHSALFSCSCFGCYTSYWVRWDESPNRQLIHEIIDAFEEWLALRSNKGRKNGKGKKEKRNKKGCGNHSGVSKRPELASPVSNDSGESESVGESSASGGGGEVGDAVALEEKGSVRRFMSFVGEKIWGAWGQ